MSSKPVFQKPSVVERAIERIGKQSIVPLRDRSIGAVLIDSGRLSPANAERVLELQRSRDLRFGEAAIELGILTSEDIEFALSRQFEYAVLPMGDAAIAGEVMAAFQPGHRTVEALRHLRTQLQLRWLDAMHSRKCLAILSAEAGAGRSFVAANLAILFAQLGERTLLVDADLRSPRQHRLFRIDNTVGLSTVLTERIGLERAMPIEAFKRLSIMPAGPVAPNPQELLSRAPFARFIEAARAAYDVVLFDTPAWSAGADAQVISARAGASVLVARPGRTRLRSLDGLVAALNECGTPLVGSVANRV